MSQQANVIHSYRHLYRGLLRAVQYSSPARYVARDQLRAAFREPPRSQTASSPARHEEAVKRTRWFIEAAAKERGIEHKILKNLLRVRLLAAQETRQWKKVLHESKSKDPLKAERSSAMQHYDMTVAMLNQSMGLLLR